ncbi:MAG TPA: protease pro-enzyme activation domain-containing protein, partial [Ktedonobacteraceae bacterium]|nr:protease pro-enzyme activation domain-containing protein [Ktedonobacteraceae bacterium]
MRKKVGVIVGLLIILVVGGLIIPTRFFHSAHAETQSQPVDVGNLPSILSLSQLLGSDTANRTLQMSVGLALRNQDQLSALLQSLYDPSSSNYHQYLTPDQFAQQFGPTASQRQQVIDYLTGQGFTVTQTYSTLIDFSGSESLAERVFGVSINDYTSPDGR